MTEHEGDIVSGRSADENSLAPVETRSVLIHGRNGVSRNASLVESRSPDGEYITEIIVYTEGDN